MAAGILADAVVLIHLLFIVFVVLGGLLVLRRPGLIWLHVPALIWGALVEFTGWLCPLTPLENSLRQLAGEAGYSHSFIAEYLLPIIYPLGLTRETQWLLGVLVLVVNALVYAYVIKNRAHKKTGAGSQ